MPTVSDDYETSEEIKRDHRDDEDMDEERREREGVYGEWCRDPAACIPLGHCPKDPTCGD